MSITAWEYNLPKDLKEGLTDAEKILIQKIQTDEYVDFRSANEDKEDPGNDYEWGMDRTIRAEFLHWLCLNKEILEKIPIKGLHIIGAKIKNLLDFERCILPRPLSLQLCSVREGIILSYMELPQLNLSGSLTTNILARKLFIRGDLNLNNIRTQGELYLAESQIKGGVFLNGAILKNPDGRALSLSGASIDGNLSMQNGVQTYGEVRLNSAKIGLSLYCDGANMRNRGGVALFADCLSTEGGAFFRSGFQAEGEINLRSAKIGATLEFREANLRNPNGFALNADRLSAKGGAYFLPKFQAEGELNIKSADIGTNLEFDGAILNNSKATALNAEGISSGGSVFLRRGFHAEGAVRLLGAKIGGQLDCSGATFKNSNRFALNGEGITTAGSVFFTKGFQAEGEVRLLNAKIGGQLNFSGAQLSNRNGFAFNADGLATKGSAFFREKFRAEGEVRFPISKIGATIEFDGAILNNEKGTALNVDCIETGGGIYLRNGFQAHGTVRISGAKVGTTLSFSGAALKNFNGYALIADNLLVQGSVFFRESFQAEGEVHLANSKIGGTLDFSTAYLKNTSGNALSAARITTEGGVYFNNGFRAKGELSLRSAKIGESLQVNNAILENLIIGNSLTLDNTQIMRDLQLKNIHKLKGLISLKNVKTQQLDDDSINWKKLQILILDGFEYDGFSSDSPTTASERLKWLSLQPSDPFKPRPYVHLANVFRSMGKETDAREVLIAKNRILRKSKNLSSTFKLWNLILEYTIGYGYKPWKILFWFIIPLLLGWEIFFNAEILGTMVPTKERVYMELEQGKIKNIPQLYPKFNPLIYSLDLLLPIINFKQVDYWIPELSKPYGAFFCCYYWIHVLLGWILTSFAVAAITGLVKKE